MSYLEMKDECKKAFDRLSPVDLSIYKLADTIRDMYINGARDMDDKWRQALVTYCNNHNISHRDIFFEMINILNKK